MMTDSDLQERKKNPDSAIDIIRRDDPDAFMSLLKKLRDGRWDAMSSAGFLHLSAKLGAGRIVAMLLIDERFDPWVRDREGYLPIDHALAKNHMDIYEKLDSAMYPSGWWTNEEHAEV